MILTFSGPSTIGKSSTWVRIAEENGFKRVVPYTTRSMRPNELEGFDYHFLAVEQFQEKIIANQFINWDYFNGNYYGTGIEILTSLEDNDLVFHVLARMGLRIKNILNNLTTVMLLPSNEKVLSERLREREYTENEIATRYNHYLEEKAHAPLFDYIIPDAEFSTDYEASQMIMKITELAKINL